MQVEGIHHKKTIPVHGHILLNYKNVLLVLETIKLGIKTIIDIVKKLTSKYVALVLFNKQTNNKHTEMIDLRLK